jgi:hypothetical protein
LHITRARSRAKVNKRKLIFSLHVNIKTENTFRGKTMNTRRHFIVGLLVATVSLLFNQNVPFLRIELFGVELTVFALCIAVSVLVDFDHIIDFRVNRKQMWMPLEKLFREGRMFVVFHSIENAIVLTFLSFFFPFLMFPTISYICHITMDAFGNSVSWQAYFYIFRFQKWINANIQSTNTIMIYSTCA